VGGGNQISLFLMNKKKKRETIFNLTGTAGSEKGEGKEEFFKINFWGGGKKEGKILSHKRDACQKKNTIWCHSPTFSGGRRKKEKEFHIETRGNNPQPNLGRKRKGVPKSHFIHYWKRVHIYSMVY